MSARTSGVLLAVAAVLAGCGLKGPLYLPEKSKEVVVRPGPSEAAQPATGGSSGATGESAPTSEEPRAAPEPPPVPDDSQIRPPGSSRG